MTHKHKYHFILCGCMSVDVHTRDFRHKQSFRRLFLWDSRKSFRVLPLAHLHASVGQIRPGNYRSPQHSRPGNTQLHLNCCLCTHTQTHMWKVIFFSCSWHKKAPVLIIWQVNHEHEQNCLWLYFHKLFCSHCKKFSQQVDANNSSAASNIYIYIYIYIYKFNWITYN